jgi:tetratricopeptide (TPR) repeat protein
MGDDPTVVSCPDEESLADYISRAAGLDSGRQASVEHHLAQCHPCRQVVAVLARRPETLLVDRTVLIDRAAGHPPDHNQPVRFGRYVVASRLGAGAMGVVYAAYDPELDRRVAIKALHLAVSDRSDNDDQARLVREAKALARLTHPNVVAVHDVGVSEDGRVWLAMELVRGQTLDTWLRARKRSWGVVLERLIQAGRGLRAVHAAGLLHRDFKPANIMVESTEDGDRARIMDFGLVRTTHSPGATLPAQTDSMALSDAAVAVTRTGALIGTPAYMSPEQFDGRPATPLSDQFSFCATLWEALFGVRPFSGQTLPEISAAVLHGKMTAPPRGQVPSWLRRLLERGLSTNPSLRWPSMHAVLDALQRGRTRARWRRGVGVVALVGLVPAGFMGVQKFEHQRHIAACERAGASIAESWNDQTRATVRDALIATNVSYALETANKVMPWFDAYARSWQRARTEACLDGEVHGTWDADALDRGLWCLDERRMEFEALVSELSRAESKSVQMAVQAAAELGQLAPCREIEFLRGLPSPPSEHREEVRGVRAAFSRATTLERTGAYEEGLAVARDALRQAEALAWPPLVAESRLVFGGLLSRTGDYASAEAAVEISYFEAARAGSPDVALRAAEELAFTVGVDLVRHEEGLRWSRLAEVTLASLPHANQTLMAKHLSSVASIHNSMGSHEEAKTLHERALAIREQTLGPEHPNIATSLNNLAGVYSLKGAFDDATPLYERALAIREKTLGPEHPEVASSLNNLANVNGGKGAYDDAEALYERALSIREKSLGPEHPSVATTLSNLAHVYSARGAHEEAATLCERALAIYEATLGPEHPNVASSLSNLAIVHQATGAYDEAKAQHERALSIYERALGVEHPSVAIPLVGLAEIAFMQQRPEDAVRLAERVLTVHETSEATSHDLAVIHFLLAQALWDASRDRPRAIDLAEQARDAYRDASDAPGVTRVEAWLEAHPPRR